MASGPEHDIAQLNKLIEITLDSAQGYIEAAGSSRNAKSFQDRGSQRHDIAQRLQARVKSLGGDAAQTGGLQRRFTNLGDGTSVEAGEKQLNEAYQAAVLDAELSDPIRMAIESEFAQIQASNKPAP